MKDSLTLDPEMQSMAALLGTATVTSPLRHRVAALRHIALDLDGTIYCAGKLFPTAVPFLRQLGTLGIGYTFVTNNSSRSTSDYLEHLRALGIPAEADQIVTSTHATIRFLRKHHPGVRRLFVLGTTSLIGEIAAAGFECLGQDSEIEPDAVVVGFDTALEYHRLCRAAWWIKQGKLYLATHPDRVCPADHGTVLVDCGSVCAALREATGRRPDAVLGKPDPAMLDTILEQHQISSHHLAMVGDRLSTDIAMARQIGVLSVLVLSGEATRADAAAAETPPDMVVQGLQEFGTILDWARRTLVSV
ncbi:MAG: HAD-IIA family hydrolase [Verrucomicrobiota bacterium]